MTEVSREISGAPDTLGDLASTPKPVHFDAVPVIGVQTRMGVIVTISGVSLGIAEPDGSEYLTDGTDVAAQTSVDKPMTDYELLINGIKSNTGGDVQEVALYLAEHTETRMTATVLGQRFGTSRTKMARILETIRERSVLNHWPFLLKFSHSHGAHFVSRKEAFSI